MIAAELSAPCPPGRLLSLGDCVELRPFGVAVVGLAALLYVGGLSAVRWWVLRLRRSGTADERAARDWYLIAAALGLGIAPLLAFTIVAAVR